MSTTTVKINELELADNVRSSMDTKGLDDLAQSIAENGLLSPLTVSPNGGDHLVVVAGHRRTMAIRRGIDDGLIHPDFEIPVIVRDDAKAGDNRLVLQLVENLQREDLGVMDEARGFAALKDMGVAQKDIARRVSCSEAHVSKRLSLLRLPEDVQEIVEAGVIPLEAAIELPKLSADGARDLAKRGQHLSVREVKQRIDHEKRAKAKAKVIDQLTEAGITVWANFVPKDAIPEGKHAVYGNDVTAIADLPKRLAGVVVRDYSTEIELTPVTFKAPTKAEQEANAEHEAEHARLVAERDQEKARYVAAVDNFVESPPPAAELVAMLARVLTPSGSDSTWLVAKDKELAEEGRTLQEWQLSGEMSSVEARRLLANVLVAQVGTLANGWSMKDADSLEALIAFGAELGVEYPQYIQDNVLSLLRKAWKRDEAAAEEAIAQAEAEAEVSEAGVGDAPEGSDAEGQPEG